MQINRIKSAFLVIFSLVVIVYLVNIITPLRLNTDGIRYLSITEYLMGNEMFNYAKDDFYPHGYPLILLLINYVSLPYVETVIIINLLSLIVGTIFYCKIFNIKDKIFVTSLVLLSWVNIKHFTLFLPDQLFMLISAISIYYIGRSFKTGNFNNIFWASITLLVGIYLRTAGIFLLGGIFSYLIFIYLKSNSRNAKIYITGLFAISTIGIYYFWDTLVKRIDYLNQLKIQNLFTTYETNIIQRSFIHFRELGEITLNIGTSQLQSIFGESISVAILIFTGAILSIITTYLIIRNKAYNYFNFWAILAYSTMLFLWPFYDSRFFIPLIPVVIITLIKIINLMINRNAGILIATPFICLGFISLIYTTRLSLDRDYFLEKYGNTDELRKNYKSVFEKREIEDTDKEIIFLLKKYN